MTISRRRFIKNFVKSKLDAIRKRWADKRSQKQIAKQIAKTTKPKPMSSRLWRFLIISPFVLLLVIVIINYLPSQPKVVTSVESTATNQNPQTKLPTVSKVDNVVEAGIVASVAEQANLPVAIYAANTATSAEIQASAVQKAEPILAKPEIASLGGGRQGVKIYTVRAGETVDQLAARYGISDQTIKWANSLTSNDLSEGKELAILPVNGVYYTVKDGDTYESIVERYGSNAGQIVAINNLELSGLVAGTKVVIPDGILPETERPGYKPPVRRPVFKQTVYAGNKYAPGWCTWYAYNRFAQLNGGRTVGSNWGNARTWDTAAIASGAYTVTRGVPMAGAVFQTKTGWAGHVGIVESINYNNNGSISSINVSDMNGINHCLWCVGYETWTAETYSKYTFIR
ncbi:MAG: LysM peptidoglycan-binding domain-containing protein [Candidatus Nanosyncoccaceae bacterium]